MRALSFGEILWDIIEGAARIGGAPFNLAAHLAKMKAAQLPQATKRSEIVDSKEGGIRT